MHHPTDRIAHTTAFVTPVVETGWNEKYRKKYLIFKFGDKPVVIATVSCKHTLTLARLKPHSCGRLGPVRVFNVHIQSKLL